MATPTIPFSPRKKFLRRLTSDRSPLLRRSVQFAFVALNLVLGLRFYLWVRAFESGATPDFARPAGADGWLPIEGLMNTRYLLSTGRIPGIHPSAMVLFLAFVATSLLFKKAFCAWLCPVGTLSEYLWKLGRRIFRSNAAFPRWLDMPLRSLKYLLLAFFAYVIFSMPADAILFFLSSPYGLLADVKMLNFFRHLGQTATIVLAMLVLLSVLVQNFWCRYLCPYGALLGLASLLSPVKIRRDAEACIECGKCARACPSILPVDKLIQIRSAECTACLACVSVCSAENALQFALPPAKSPTPAQRWRRRTLSPAALAAGIAILFFGSVLAARLTHHWHTPIPAALYRQLIPTVDQLDHPAY